MLINAMLTYILLYDVLYWRFHVFMAALHVFLSTLLEHCVFVLAVVVLMILRGDLRYHHNSSTFIKHLKRFYFALVFPEYFKIGAIVLQVFDSETHLLFLFSCLITALTVLSVQCFTNIIYSRVVVYIAIGYLMKMLVRGCFHVLDDIVLMGVFL